MTFSRKLEDKIGILVEKLKGQRIPSRRTLCKKVVRHEEVWHILGVERRPV